MSKASSGLLPREQRRDCAIDSLFTEIVVMVDREDADWLCFSARGWLLAGWMEGLPHLNLWLQATDLLCPVRICKMLRCMVLLIALRNDGVRVLKPS